jgi:hypothetical protein
MFLQMQDAAIGLEWRGTVVIVPGFAELFRRAIAAPAAREWSDFDKAPQWVRDAYQVARGQPHRGPYTKEWEMFAAGLAAQSAPVAGPIPSQEMFFVTKSISGVGKITLTGGAGGVSAHPDQPAAPDDVAALIARLTNLAEARPDGPWKQCMTEAAAKLAELARERDRLTGKMCLICGRLEPCEEAPDACTFDPHPIDAARAFLNRAHKAEAERDKLRELLRRSRSWVDALMDAKLCAAIDAALAEGKK